MTSEKLHETTSAGEDASPCPKTSQQPRTLFLKRLESFCRHFKCSKKLKYESTPSDHEDEPSVLSPAKIRANQLVAYFDNNLGRFCNDFKPNNNTHTGGSTVKSVRAVDVDDQGGYHFNCQIRDGEDWDIYYFEEPVSKDLGFILNESVEAENIETVELNGTTSQSKTTELSNNNDETNRIKVKETIPTPAAFDKALNDFDNESNYELSTIEDVNESYRNPCSKDPDKDCSTSSVYSREITGSRQRCTLDHFPPESTAPTDPICPKSTAPINSTPSETSDYTATLPPEPLFGFKKIFFEKILIHRHLKQITQLECIPEIPCWEVLDHETDGIVGGDGWIAEENRHGSQVKITYSKTSCNTDKISILVNDKWIPLKGRKKQRFIDDLARIQIAYSTVTSPHLGPVELQYTADVNHGIFPSFHLKDERTSLTADVTPTVKFPKTHFLRLRHRAPPFLKHLVSNFPTPQAGPYPLQPPAPIWPHLRVNPKSGNIIRLSNCHEIKSVPWEIAAYPPLQLSSAAQERWIHSLHRHWWGAYIRDRSQKFASQPKLDRLVFSNDLVGLECLLRLREDSSKEEIEVLERKMVNFVGKGKSHREMKRQWVLDNNPDYVI